jgi:hypothetical protein
MAGVVVDNYVFSVGVVEEFSTVADRGCILLCSVAHHDWRSVHHLQRVLLHYMAAARGDSIKRLQDVVEWVMPFLRLGRFGKCRCLRL